MRERMENDLLETVKLRIRERLRALRISANEASFKAKLGLSYVTDILNGRSKNPNLDRLEQLAKEALDCDLDYLLGKYEAFQPAVGVMAMKLYSPSLPEDGRFILNQGRISSFKSPISGPPQYAVTIPDDSNAPRYTIGETVICDPAASLSRHGFVLVTTVDGKSVIGRFLGISSEKISLDTVSGTTVEIQRNDMEYAHRIIASVG